MIERVMIAGGGTGGHLFPGVAVVEELRRRNPALQVVFVGTERGVEARVLPKMGEQLELMDVRPLVGRSPAVLLRNLAQLPASGMQAVTLLRRYRPQIVIGVGGYASGPVLAAATALRIPTALLEQNVHVGLTNRMLARGVGRAYLTHGASATHFPAAAARVVGNPVRRAFVDAARLATLDPDGARARGRRIFVLGGSQGARALNERLPMALGRAGVGAQGVRVLHQAGRDMVDAVARRYADVGIEAEVVPFIDDMARAYSHASLVVARAGASTLAELCAIGRPSLLIPFPHAAADHQAKNALALQEAGAAVALREEHASVEEIASQVSALLSDPARREQMAHRARELGRPDAAAAIVDDLCEWLGLRSDVPPDAVGTAAGGGSTRSDIDGGGISRRTKVRRCELRVQPVVVPVREAGAPALGLARAAD